MCSLRTTGWMLAVLACTAASLGQSQPAWRVMPALNGEGRTLLVTSGNEAGGNGLPALWLGGDFSQVGAVATGRVARLSAGAGGGAWTTTGGAFNYSVATLCEHDNGSGPKVYVGGSFSLATPQGGLACVAAYNGSSWSPLPSGYALTWCYSLWSYQFPGQPAKLLVSGSPSGGNNYARALGPGGWEDVGGEFITVVDFARMYDDGGGLELFTGNGTFNGANKFNGVRRATLGGNCSAAPQWMVPMGEGASRRMIVGGPTSFAAGVQVAGVASWNGTAWSALGGPGWGLYRANGGTGTAHAGVLWDDGSGEKLWVGGQFAQVGGNSPALRVPAANIACWDGAAWSVPSAGGITGVPNNGAYRNGAEAMVVFDFDGPGGRPPSLVIAGQFSGAGGVAASNLAVLDAAWCGPADVGRQGGVRGADGHLDNNDFVVFIDLFFAGDVRADLGVQGGVPGRDGTFDNNDVVVFIDRFFGGCG